MAFCSNCGKELNSGARFCDGCGTPVSGAENKRNTVFEGDIHKCPNCGEVLNSFVVNCPSCGYELRDVQSSKEIRIFNARLNTFYDRNEKIDFIREYPIPNSKEAIWEFVNLASSNIASYDKNGDGTIDKNEQAYIDAWKTLQNRCRDKAKKIYAMDSCEMKEIEELIAKSEKSLNQGVRKTKAKKVVQTSSNIFITLMKWLWQIVAFLGKTILKAIQELWKTKIGKIILVILALSLIFTISNYFNDLKDNNSSNDDGDVVTTVKQYETISWNELILSSMLPTPNALKGKIVSDSEKELSLDMADATKLTLTSYIQACKEKGFTIDILQETNSFRAFNEEGYRIKLFYSEYYDELSINLIDPIKRNTINWSSVPLMADIPKPPSSTGEFGNNYDWTVTIYLVDVTRDQYDAYIDKCIEEGFSIDMSRYDNTFYGDNKDGIELQISWEGNNTICIHVTNLELL